MLYAVRKNIGAVISIWAPVVLVFYLTFCQSLNYVHNYGEYLYLLDKQTHGEEEGY